MTGPRCLELGPWELVPGARLIIGSAGQRRVVLAACGLKFGVFNDDGVFVTASTDDPNVRLILAAPDLWMTLRNVLKVVDGEPGAGERDRKGLLAALEEIRRIATDAVDAVGVGS